MNGIFIGMDEDGKPFHVPEDVLAEHAMITGGSGKGKSSLLCILVREQLKRGASLVAVDPEPETLWMLRGLCQDAGLPPKRVVTIDARDPEGAPGLNPFRAKSHPADAATSVSELFEKSGAYEGASRVQAFMQAAIPVAAWHGLPFMAVLNLITDEVYRSEVLASEPRHKPSRTYETAKKYLQQNLKDIKTAAQSETGQSVHLRFARLMSNELFLTMFESEENTVDFDSLFAARQPGAVMVCTQPGMGMTEASGQMMAGIIFDLLFAAASRNPGKRPVVLAVDEVGTLGPLLEASLSKVVNQARKRNVRLIVACQHAGQLPEGVRADVLVSSALKAYFHPGEEMTNSAATALAKASRRGADEPLPEAEPEIRPQRLRLYGYNGHRPREGLIPIVPDPPMPSGRYLDPRADTRPVDVNPNYPERSLGMFLKAAREYLPYVATEDAVDIRPFLRGLPPGCAVGMAGQTRMAVRRTAAPAQGTPDGSEADGHGGRLGRAARFVGTRRSVPHRWDGWPGEGTGGMARGTSGCEQALRGAIPPRQRGTGFLRTHTAPTALPNIARTGFNTP